MRIRLGSVLKGGGRWRWRRAAHNPATNPVSYDGRPIETDRPDPRLIYELGSSSTMDAAEWRNGALIGVVTS